jgi:hypothetical protein
MMPYQQLKRDKLNWSQYSLALMLVYALLQLLRWRILPQFMDIYYHILTAWGFIQAGGYVGWDFWQYAPVGRVHIYPPFFHIVLAFLMKCGADTVILAKLFETVMPVVFLIVLWSFIRRNYSRQLAFFTVVAFGSSFSFYLALLNHIPATLAGIFGLLAVDRFLEKRLPTAVIFLALCFYTHIGSPWFFSLTVLFYGLMDKEKRKVSLFILLWSVILSAPVLFKELAGLEYIKSLGFNLQEKFTCQFKIAEYALAIAGLYLALRKGGRHRLFLAFFLASLIFLFYPYRFFSAEGYLVIVLLCGLALSELFNFFTVRIRLQNHVVLSMLVLLEIFSPTLAMDKTSAGDKAVYRFKSLDSAFLGMLFARGDSLWLPSDYSLAAEIVKKNSGPLDIVYSTLNPVGMSLSGISGRPTANALFTEIGPAQEFDRFAVSKIIIFPADEDKGLLEVAVGKYKLEKIGETKALVLYRNPGSRLTAKARRASTPFWAIAVFMLVAAMVLLKNRHKIYLT